MKLAVLADIHGNFVALETVTAHLEAWQPDLVIVAGDIVNRGPRSLDCLQFVQKKQREEGWLVTRGNHEDYVIAIDNPHTPWQGPQYELYQPVYWTYQQLGRDVLALQAMPDELSLTAPDGSEICITHASRLSNKDGIFPFMVEDDIRPRIAPPVPLICVGHTHCPLIKQIDNSLVVNVGSVGLPFDYNWHISYAQLYWRGNAWQTDIIRLPYNRKQAEQDMIETGFLETGGPLAKLILDELQNAHSLMYSWTHKYEKAILAQEISMANAVAEFMAKLK